MKHPAPILEVTNLIAGYEPTAPIVNDVSLTLEQGELVAILGPNGAGKSTLVKAIAGLVPIRGGSVRLRGLDITAQSAHLLVRDGLAFVPQTDNVFATMSVEDNLKVAAQAIPTADRRQRIAAAYELFADLARQRGLLAQRLSGGQRQMLAVARALIVAPAVLVLDEPSAGLSPKVVDQVFRKLREVRDSGVGVVLVEQNVRAALSIADRVYVLVEGRNRLDGMAADLARDPAIAALYLGGTRALAGGAR